jgi:phosphatidylserine/phosphatidylglycerophosphate/cardiolipin synthase-like enzyme
VGSNKVYARIAATFGTEPNAIEKKFTTSGGVLEALERGADGTGTSEVFIDGEDRGIAHTAEKWPYSFAPKGRQSARAQLIWAISSARYFIYFEDQYMVSKEIAEALNEALKRGVWVLGVIPHQDISTDFEFEQLPPVRKTLFIEKVLKDVPFPELSFQLFCPKHVKKPPEGSEYQYVHPKVWIFDDEFCTIGSMNINDRGTTHDSELAAGFYEQGDGSKRYGFAHRLRMRLWARLLGKTNDELDQLVDPFECRGLWKQAAHAVPYDWSGPDFDWGERVDSQRYGAEGVIPLNMGQWVEWIFDPRTDPGQHWSELKNLDPKKAFEIVLYK